MNPGLHAVAASLDVSDRITPQKVHGSLYTEAAAAELELAAPARAGMGFRRAF